MKALFFPMDLDIRATVGITIKVVTNDARLPKSVGQSPAAPASPLNKCHTIIKNENAAMVLNALKIKNVEMHSFTNGFNLNAAIKFSTISNKLLPIVFMVSGEYPSSLSVDLLLRNMAGTIAKSIQAIPTHTASVLVATSADSNQP